VVLQVSGRRDVLLVIHTCLMHFLAIPEREPGVFLMSAEFGLLARIDGVLNVAG
jgi:hypothetical protein